MTPHTIGLLGPNGKVGAPTVQALLRHEAQGTIKLVLLHRPNGPPRTKLPASVQVREIDLDGESKQIESAVKGIHVFM